MTNFDDCKIGRRVELNVAKMQKDILYTKEKVQNVGKNVENLHNKFDLLIDNLDKKYASKVEFETIKKEFNWIKATIATSIIGLIVYFIQLLFTKLI